MIPESVVTVGLRRPSQSARSFEALMKELQSLVETAGGRVIKQFMQNRPHPEPGTLLGKGKIVEIGQDVKKIGVKTVIFDDDLTAAQQKNIEKLLPAKVVDRTRLILDIFAQRAHTREGQLQVELAQLNYLVPRLTGSWRGYSQQVGGIGTRGPGERKIEVERRYVRERIKRLETAINEVRHHREHMRENRRTVPLPQIALTGYTNVGKSTLLNTLIGENEVYADDKLFATLDPTTRRVKLPGGRTVLFTDTVGFIQKLPTHLVAAFKATLEEVTQATLIVHLVDASAENYKEQIKVVLDIIKNLKADHIPMITVFNKTDIAPIKSALSISARTGKGVDNLLHEVEQKLDATLIDVTFHLPHSKRHLVADIYRSGYVLSEKPSDNGVMLHMRIDPDNWKRISYETRNNTNAR